MLGGSSNPLFIWQNDFCLPEINSYICFLVERVARLGTDIIRSVIIVHSRQLFKDQTVSHGNGSLS